VKGIGGGGNGLVVSRCLVGGWLDSAMLGTTM